MVRNPVCLVIVTNNVIRCEFKCGCRILNNGQTVPLIVRERTWIGQTVGSIGHCHRWVVWWGFYPNSVGVYGTTALYMGGGVCDAGCEGEMGNNVYCQYCCDGSMQLESRNRSWFLFLIASTTALRVHLYSTAIFSNSRYMMSTYLEWKPTKAQFHLIVLPTLINLMSKFESRKGLHGQGFPFKHCCGSLDQFHVHSDSNHIKILLARFL